MVNFSRINDIDYVKVGEATEAHDGMEARSLLTAKKINGIVEQMTSGRNSSLVYNKVKAAHADWPGTGPYQNPKYAKPSAKILKEYSTSTTALLQSLCLLQEYLDALDKYQRSQNPLFYLERQLSWIGFSYNKHNWVGYEERMGELTDFLEKYATVGIPKEEQSTFAQECLELLLKLPMPIMTLYKDRSRYEQRSQKSLTLGKKRMNRVFQELEIPYEVTSKQASSGDRKTVWFVRHI